MRTEAEIQQVLTTLETQGNEFEDLYEENFVAIKALRWILGLPAPVDHRRREED